MATAQTAMPLEMLLNRKTVSELRQLARGYYIKGTSKLKKRELVSAVCEALCSQERLSELLYVVHDSSWSIFNKIIRHPEPLQLNAREVEYCSVFNELSYVSIILEDKRPICYMSDEIRCVFEEMVKKGFIKSKTRNDLIHSYAMAATNLYGVISQDDFVQLFNAQNQEHTSIEEVFLILLKHIAVDAPYCFWDEYIVCDEFEENDFKDVRDLLARIADKPRYIPDKKEFLRYSDWDYFEQTDSTLRFEEYLCSRMGLSHKAARELITEIHFAIAVEANTQQIFNILYENIDDLSSTQFGEIAELVMNMSNSTRLWSNNGHTPEELSRLFRQPKLIQFPGQQKQQKIGRNDLCPCGSGKKYKKCCGR